MEIPLKIRDILIPTPLELDFCSSDCLFKKNQFIQAIPIGFSAGTDGDSSFLNFLFVTDKNTIVKKTKSRIPSEVFKNSLVIKGVENTAHATSHCACSIEFQKFDGKIVEIIDSVHYRSLAAKYSLFKFKNQVEIFYFVSSSLKNISELNKLGFTHTDPTYWNFLFDGTNAKLIDIEEIGLKNQKSMTIQTSRLIEFLISPIMRMELSQEIHDDLLALIINSSVLPFDESELKVLLELSNRGHDASMQHFKSTQQLMHMGISYSETKRTYERYIDNLRQDLEKTSHYQTELIAKEKVIQEIANKLKEMVLSNEKITNSESQLLAKEKILQNQKSDLELQLIAKEKVIQDCLVKLAEVEKKLVSKEEVIQSLLKSSCLQMIRALRYRLAHSRFSPVRLIRRLWRRIFEISQPRLGNLNQYRPRLLKLEKYATPSTCMEFAPKIAIVTPSYQQGAFIERTLNSVISQEYPNLEYFVQDGASNDNTVDILKKYNEKLSGWVSEKDGGQSQAINLGLSKTSGEILAWLNSDDLLLPGTLHVVADFFNRHPDVDVVYGNRLLIDENDRQIGRWILPGHDGKVLSWADYIPQETLFWRRRIWDKVGGKIDESFRFAMDWDLLIRFRDAGAKFAHIPQFLGAFRIHEHQKTSASINEIGHQEMERIRERILGYVPHHKEIRRAILPYLVRHILVDMMYRIKERLRLEK